MLLVSLLVATALDEADPTWPPALPLLAGYTEAWERLTTPPPPPPSPPSPDGCEPWCDPTWPMQHCADERCDRCGFCAARVGCMADWCAPSLAEQHCLKGECLPCAFCLTVCPKWCDKRYTNVHCAIHAGPTRPMDCSHCSFCANWALPAESSESAVAKPRKECANWCRERNKEVHCEESSCAACGFCQHRPAAAGQPPTQQSPVASHAACVNWCRARNADVHCEESSCAACAFCPAAALTDSPGLAKKQPGHQPARDKSTAAASTMVPLKVKLPQAAERADPVSTIGHPPPPGHQAQLPFPSNLHMESVASYLQSDETLADVRLVATAPAPVPVPVSFPVPGLAAQQPNTPSQMLFREASPCPNPPPAPRRRYLLGHFEHHCSHRPRPHHAHAHL